MYVYVHIIMSQFKPYKFLLFYYSDISLSSSAKLKSLCRRSILTNVRASRNRDGKTVDASVDTLPIPPSLKRFVLEHLFTYES